jgi:hypothetical protein
LVIWLLLCSHSLSHGWPLETGLSTIVRLPHTSPTTRADLTCFGERYRPMSHMANRIRRCTGFCPSARDGMA